MALIQTKLTEPGVAERDPAALLPPRSTVGGPAALPRRSLDRAVVIQFIQFCTVGALSTVLNEGLFNLFWALSRNQDGSFILAFCLAVTSGFFLNRAWTFRRSRAHKAHRQYVMFFAVNLVGLGLSWLVTKVTGAWLLRSGWSQAVIPLVQRLAHHPVPVDHLAYSLGLLAATVPCSVWNFSANKLWTFSGARVDKGMR